MNIGEYYFTEKLGTIKISKIKHDEELNPQIIEVTSKDSTHRIMMQFAKLRLATQIEIIEFEKHQNAPQPKTYSLITEIPNIKSVFRTWIYKVTKSFIDNNPNIKPNKYGASTNIFYCEYLLSIDDKIECKPYDFRCWKYYNFNDNKIEIKAFQLIRPRLQNLLFGEGDYESMTGENNHKIQTELMNIVIEAFLIVKETIPLLRNCKIEIADHDDLNNDADERLKRIISSLEQ